MGESKVSVLIILVIFVLDIVAFSLSLGAETQRTKGVEKKDGEYRWCLYKTDIATGLGAGAFLFLLAAQVLIMAVTRCLCCGGALRPGVARAFAIVYFIFTWCCFIIAGICQIFGAAHNTAIYKYDIYLYGNDYTCRSLRKGIFASGAAFTFLNFVFGIGYYLCYAKAEESPWKSFNKGNAGIGMTQYR